MEAEVKQHHIVICYSGGLDSLLMKKYAEFNYPDSKITTLFIDHGQEAVEQEMKALPEHVQIKKMDWLGEDIKPVAKKSMPLAGPIYIPGRNMVFAAMAAAFYCPNEIWMGVLFDEDNERATDKNTEFRQKMSATLGHVMSPFVEDCKLVFPFAQMGMTKFDAIAYCFAKGLVTKEELLATTSCWHNTGKPCGKCLQCVKRALIFRNFGIYEEYAGISPLNKNNGFSMKLMEGYLKTVNPDFEERMMCDLVEAYQNNEIFEGEFV